MAIHMDDVRADTVDVDVGARLGGSSIPLIVADVSAEVLFDTNTAVTPSLGALVSPGEATWLTAALHLRATDTTEIAVGCAVPYLIVLVSYLDDGAFPCRPYVEVGAWALPQPR